MEKIANCASKKSKKFMKILEKNLLLFFTLAGVILGIILGKYVQFKFEIFSK